MKKTNQTKRSRGRTTSYSRAMETTRVIDGITVKLALQKRTSEIAGVSW